MLKLYKNKNQEFSCKITIEGADKSTAKPRLILYPDNDSRNVFFEGIIEDDTCKIRVLPNLNISQNGKAVLEIIIEDSILFKPWKTEYEIITETVKVDEIHISNTQIGASVKVIEDDIKIDDSKLVIEKKTTPKKQIIKKVKTKTTKPIEYSIKNKSMDDLLQEAANMIEDDDVTNDKKLLKIYAESIKSLTKEDLEKMVKHVNSNYIPSKKSLLWAKKVLGETKSIKSKLLMYCNEIKK